MTTSADFTWNDEPEEFRFMTVWFDVRAAKKAIRETPQEVCSVDLTSVFNLIGEPPNPDGSPGKVVMGVAVDWKRALSDETDLDIPIIIGKLQTDWADLLPIDGWHRIAKAKARGRSILPAIILSPELTRQISNLGVKAKPKAKPRKPRTRKTA